MAIFMTAITTRISNELDIIVSNVAKEIDRPKGYIIRKAIESYLYRRKSRLISCFVSYRKRRRSNFIRRY
ncbi:putative antitoxin of toxin-antitoxin [Rickettsia montanensis str. OSU 85-930]|uniref:Putative antitoxin of toxin-antitoxin n=1 Tax=Rickettsia montanensis (strain OSU 85-930) TaxID=1105114 RepID=H8KBL1_RICMS|nr:putative antitoxin of toxin-antitoxin [Rickettsia montanensis str. OSU 85-930]